MLKHMARTTINIEPAIFKKIRELSDKLGATQTQLITLFLNLGIKSLESDNAKLNAKAELKLRSAGSGGTRNNIDIGDRSQVWAVFEEEDLRKYSK